MGQNYKMPKNMKRCPILGIIKDRQIKMFINLPNRNSFIMWRLHNYMVKKVPSQTASENVLWKYHLLRVQFRNTDQNEKYVHSLTQQFYFSQRSCKDISCKYVQEYSLHIDFISKKLDINSCSKQQNISQLLKRMSRAVCINMHRCSRHLVTKIVQNTK